MVPLILEPLLLKGNDDFFVVITFQNKVFHNEPADGSKRKRVVIIFQNKVFHNTKKQFIFKLQVVITLQNKVFHNK